MSRFREMMCNNDPIVFQAKYPNQPKYNPSMVAGIASVFTDDAEGTLKHKIYQDINVNDYEEGLGTVIRQSCVDTYTTFYGGQCTSGKNFGTFITSGSLQWVAAQDANGYTKYGWVDGEKVAIEYPMELDFRAFRNLTAILMSTHATSVVFPQTSNKLRWFTVNGWGNGKAFDIHIPEYITILDVYIRCNPFYDPYSSYRPNVYIHCKEFDVHDYTVNGHKLALVSCPLYFGNGTDRRYDNKQYAKLLSRSKTNIRNTSGVDTHIDSYYNKANNLNKIYGSLNVGTNALKYTFVNITSYKDVFIYLYKGYTDIATQLEEGNYIEIAITTAGTKADYEADPEGTTVETLKTFAVGEDFADYDVNYIHDGSTTLYVMFKTHTTTTSYMLMKVDPKPTSAIL